MLDGSVAKEMAANRRRTIAGVRWQHIKRTGRAAWFLSRSRRSTPESPKRDKKPKVFSLFSARDKRKCESESSSLLSDAATQMDAFSDSEDDDDLKTGKHENDDRDANLVQDEPVVESMRKRSKKIGAFVSLDCEMVGGGTNNKKNLLARCAVLNGEGEVILDEYILPSEPITDYRTQWSGIRPGDLIGAPSFREVRQRVADLVRGRIIIGHAIDNDLRALMLPHPPALVRDTSVYPGLRQELAAAAPSYSCEQSPSLRRLCKEVLGRDIQGGEHSPVEDARAALDLYLRHRDAWEASLL